MSGFVGGPEIDDRDQVELGQGAPVGFAQAAEAVRPEQSPPCHSPTPGGRVTTEVTEIDGPVELEGSGRHPGSLRGNDVDQLATLAVDETNGAVAACEQSVVVALPDVLAGMEHRPPLAHEDGPGAHRRAAELP